VAFLDAIMVKVRDNHVVTSKPAYLALGIDTDGEKHVLGISLARTPLEEATAGESSRFWASVTADLRNRSVRDILIACCDGLSGFEDAIRAAFPKTTVQTCTLHLVRNALRPVARKDRDAVAKELRKIYTAPNADAAFDAPVCAATGRRALTFPLATLPCATAAVGRGCLLAGPASWPCWRRPGRFASTSRSASPAASRPARCPSRQENDHDGRDWRDWRERKSGRPWAGPQDSANRPTSNGPPSTASTVHPIVSGLFRPGAVG